MKGVEADAPVFIILGVLTVLVGLGIVFGIIDNFSGQAETSNEEELNSLINDIEQKCSDKDQYNTIVDTSSTFEIHGASVEIDQNSASLSGDTNIQRNIECSHTIDYESQGSKENQITVESGIYDISIGAEDGNILVDWDGETGDSCPAGQYECGNGQCVDDPEDCGGL